jgi:hypothetical protein
LLGFAHIYVGRFGGQMKIHRRKNYLEFPGDSKVLREKEANPDVGVQNRKLHTTKMIY